VWQALDSSVANLVAVVFDWTSVNQGVAYSVLRIVSLSLHAYCVAYWGLRFGYCSLKHGVVFDWTSVIQGLDPEPPIVGMVTVPFHELKDDAGFDEREWPLVQVRTQNTSCVFVCVFVCV
jgi:hypothetical protein